MSENASPAYAVLNLRFKLQVPADVLLGNSRKAASAIASVDGLIWKIRLVQEQGDAIGGVQYISLRRKTLLPLVADDA